MTGTIITTRTSTTTAARTAGPGDRAPPDPATAAGPRAGYLRDPAAIYRESFAAVRRETRLDGLPPDVAAVAVRLVHACGMPDIVADLAYSGDAVARGRAALAAGAPVVVDCAMAAAGIARDRLPRGCEVVCTLSDPETPALAARLRTTRSAAAVELWRPWLEGAVVAVGNAPTALFRLLELVAAGTPRPAVVLGFPVGFVGAAEAKEALIALRPPLPHLALRGRRGGSALAAAAVNALASEAP